MTLTNTCSENFLALLSHPVLRLVSVSDHVKLPATILQICMWPLNYVYTCQEVFWSWTSHAVVSVIVLSDGIKRRLGNFSDYSLCVMPLQLVEPSS